VCAELSVAVALEPGEDPLDTAVPFQAGNTHLLTLGSLAAVLAELEDRIECDRPDLFCSVGCSMPRSDSAESTGAIWIVTGALGHAAGIFALAGRAGDGCPTQAESSALPRSAAIHRSDL
jgi:hypothetical protein